MINSDITAIECGTNVAGVTTFHKQPVSATKKVALRDVQNNNNNFTQPFEGKSFLDASKTSGTKRFAPDYTLPLLSNNGAHECLNYPRRKYDVAGIAEKNSGHQRSANVPQMQQQVSQINSKSLHYGSLVAPNQMGSKTSVPRFKETSEEQRTERFIHLQNFIKQCDGSNNRENIELLMRLSPSELSRHAVDLEKRAIQLTIEEGKEMQRMQALNILESLRQPETINANDTTQGNN